MKITCNSCQFLSINEEQQNLNKMQRREVYPHICRKYKKQVKHLLYREPFIYPCDECLNSYSYKIQKKIIEKYTLELIDAFDLKGKSLNNIIHFKAKFIRNMEQ